MAESGKKSSLLSSVRTHILRKTSDESPGSTSPDSEPHPRDRPKNSRKLSFPSFGVSAVTRDKRDDATARAPIAPPTAKGEEETPKSGPGDAPVSSSSNGGDVNTADPSSSTLQRPPTLLVQAPSSPDLKAVHKIPNGRPVTSNSQLKSAEQPDPVVPKPPASPSRQSFTRPSLSRTSTRVSYVSNSGMLHSVNDIRSTTRDSEVDDAFEDAVQTQSKKMVKRKVWVRRPGASATLVQYNEDDLVDDVRDNILRKYANSLGRTFDSPDMTLKVQPRERSNHVGHERTLGPEEPVTRILDAYYPGGQDVSEALIIDVPQKRTPRVSPRIVNRVKHDPYEDSRPSEDDAGYFPPMPIVGQLTPQGRNVYASAHPQPHAISILETGQAPALPSPREKRTRPRPGRQHTSSPTTIGSATSTQPPQSLPYHTPRAKHIRHDSSDRTNKPTHIPAPPPLPNSPSQDVPVAALTATGHPVGTPPAVSHPAAAAVSPRLPPSSATKKRARKSLARHTSPSANAELSPFHPALNGDGQTSVPPINVLIVEDNIINLKVLEMMVGKLKVRWSTAMNGRDAVQKWRDGGFHLVLMDIQLPIMSGLEATKEIRRLERVNGIGVFAREEEDESGGFAGIEQVVRGKNLNGEVNGMSLGRRGSKDTSAEDQLTKLSFKSPVIIVALTASSLQSDRREALAAGCNDFLTKVSPFHPKIRSITVSPPSSMHINSY